MQNSSVKSFYNDVMPGKFGDDYEYQRWFHDALSRAGYSLTKEAIERHVLKDDSLDPSRILELGPGAGTWTKLLVTRFSDAYIDLLDISKEMLERATHALGKNEHVRTFESDVLEWEPTGTYDFFFSSRVLEYIDDKEKFCAKVFSLLVPGGRGFLITKMPHYARERLLGKVSSELHKGQISPLYLREMLKSAGFIDVDCYPVTVSVPIFHSPKLNLAFGRLLAPFRVGFLAGIFAESYCVVFRKPIIKK
jgi:SAM-dependent methyltransferase